MFQVKAKNKDLAITSLTMRNYEQGTVVAEVWTKTGTMIGYESNKAAWTKIADATFTPTSSWAMLKFPAFDTPVHISAGQTQSFYVTRTSGNLLWTTSTSANLNVLANEDDNLQFFHGYYNAYETAGFGGKGFGTWNGELHYVTDNGVTSTMAPTPPPTPAPVNPPTPPPTSNPTPPPTPNPTAFPTNPATLKPATRKPTTRKPTTRKPTTRKPTTRKPTSKPQ